VGNESETIELARTRNETRNLFVARHALLHLVRDPGDLAPDSSSTGVVTFEECVAEVAESV
jgi:hypothetical protein